MTSLSCERSLQQNKRMTPSLQLQHGGGQGGLHPSAVRGHPRALQQEHVPYTFLHVDTAAIAAATLLHRARRRVEVMRKGHVLSVAGVGWGAGAGGGVSVLGVLDLRQCCPVDPNSNV